jgi:oxygen-independent coproporphyrinogen-3 oxidase
MLTYEKGTPLHSDFKNRHIQPLPDERVRELFGTTIRFLEDNGYLQYEISNFVRQDNRAAAHVSLHNLKYWTRAPYIGLGPSAHSFIKSRRYWNVASVADYLTAIETGQLPIADSEVLTAEQKMIEAIYLGLRMTRGIDLAGFRKEFGIDFLRVFKDAIAEMANRNYLQADTAAVALTRKGRAFLDSIAARFIETDFPGSDTAS